ncbi:hypothetical protein V5799_028724 [Amblyomma americanum]|uniref:Peptidase S1 domain-containing protein n=1 Tax=Amblyomma americanum TaxID=6943 RepID=A0AAQ4DC19_AMBAM
MLLRSGLRRPELRLRLAGGAEYSPQRVLVHEAFDETELRHDLALLVLEKPAVARNAVVCLPHEGGRHEGRMALVSGWGSDGSPQPQVGGPPQLREASVRTLERSRCVEAYLGLLDISDEQFCAAADGVDTCQVRVRS